MGVFYRTDEEVAEWKKRDAIDMIERRMAEMGIRTLEESQAVRDAVRKEALEAIEYAESSPFPDPSELLTDVYYDPAA
jgi:pyruvate dehydrogenase E1 component alpha subunit